jgi:hypothetical protein
VASISCRFFPVEGDSTIADLCYGTDVWADVRLIGTNLETREEERSLTGRSQRP